MFFHLFLVISKFSYDKVYVNKIIIFYWEFQSNDKNDNQ